MSTPLAVKGGGSFIWEEMLGTTNEFGKWKKKTITGVLRKQISSSKPHPLPPGKALEDDTDDSLPGMSRHEFSKQGAPLLRRVLGKSITSEELCPSCPVTQPVEEVASLHS